MRWRAPYLQVGAGLVARILEQHNPASFHPLWHELGQPDRRFLGPLEGRASAGASSRRRVNRSGHGVCGRCWRQGCGSERERALGTAGRLAQRTRRRRGIHEGAARELVKADDFQNMHSSMKNSVT